MDNAFALQLILKAEQDNALHKRSRGRSKEGRQSPLMSLLQMSRLYLRANCSRCFCCWWCSYKEIRRGGGVHFPHYYPPLSHNIWILLKKDKSSQFFTLIYLSSILCSSYLKYSQCNVWRCCCGGTDLLIYVPSTYLAAEECSSVCAWWCTQKFCKTTPKISQKASPSMNKELLLSLTFGKKKSVIDTNEHTHYGTL